MSGAQRLWAAGVVVALSLGAVTSGTAVAAPTGSGAGSSSGSSEGANPLFGESAQYNVGGLGPAVGSQTMAYADFNGDGNMDVAATGVVDGTGILFGDGTGRLRRNQFVHTEVGANAVHTADLNGDGASDLVVTNFLSISVLLNDGRGVFHVDRTYATDFNPDVSYRTGGIPFGVALADFDNDGAVDLAFNNLVPVPGGVGIMRGDGQGHFGVPQWRGVGLGKASVVAGDVDNDGYADLAFHDLGTSGVWVMVNDRNGGFAAPRWNLAALPSEDLKLADADGDGNLDLLTANIAGFSASVHWGDGRGNFGPPQLIGPAAAPCAVAVGDFDGDGIPDIAAGQYVPSTAMIFKGNGRRGFDYVEQHTIGLGPQAMAAVDLTGDGRPEVISMSSLSEDVAVMVNRGNERG
ncbi:VCBS repeat-containing protein [Nocardia sp. 2]|uniref:VCBS repeat-containing protein n=1 Tax=Nocardia acididurans TaxID=2802282 RepID=A0ABS1MJK1_9NOCA|nr:VCBS repeat-containing protein [Nocardia acididurans]MBL1079418.1 VCBS repeat-containing protein [Nocardia acididurans]